MPNFAILILCEFYREMSSFNAAAFRRAIKPWMLPIAMLTGMLLHNYISYVEFLSPILIFIMLLITYCRIDLRHFRFGGYIWWLLMVQIVGAVAVYLVLRPFNDLIAQGAFMCVFCPTATAAPVVTGMLGGSVHKVATYSLVSNFAVAITAPLLLSYMNPEADISFFDTMLRVCRNILPLILGPMVLADLLARFRPRVHDYIAHHQGLSFYIWALGLLIVVGNSVSFIMREPVGALPLMGGLALVSLVVCVAQFMIGRKIGAHYGDKISASQSLGQKNTVLIIWMSLTYLNPIVSVAPAAYVAWHNTINSYQIFRYQRRHPGA